jgi:hypothetical protein
MRVLGRQVELVGVPLADLIAFQVPNIDICCEIFAHDSYYSAEKLYRHVPEFRPTVSLEAGMRQVIEAMDRTGRLPSANQEDWEDHIIAAWRQSSRGH